MITDGQGHEDVDLAATDLADTRLYAEGDPHRIWRAALERVPLWWQDVPDKRGFWSVFRYPDVDRVLRDHECFTSERGNLLDALEKGDPSAGKQLSATDPPRHTRLRSPIQRLLTAPAVQPHAAAMRAEARALLTKVPEREVFDFCDVSAEYSMRVTALVLGVPAGDLLELLPYTHAAMAPDDPAYQIDGDRERTMEQAHWEIFAYFAEVVGRRRAIRERAGGLIDQLMEITSDDGDRLADDEIISNCYGLLLGSNVASPHVPNGAVVELSRSGTYGRWASRTDMVRQVVEETLRWTSPATHFMRYASRDVRLHDRTVERGDAVVAWLGAANRDPDVFDRPYEFDPTRRPNRHLAFGVGPHYCVGHTVARIAMEEFFAELFDQLADVRVVGAIDHLRSNVAAGIARLPVSATRRAG